MRYGLVVAVVLLLAGGEARAEDFAPNDQASGRGITAWAGPVVKATNFLDGLELLAGGRAAIGLGDSFFVGAGGYGLVSDNGIVRIPEDPGPTGAMGLGYGGLLLGMSFLRDQPIHAEVLALIGGGSASVGTDGKGFFVVEPEANVELPLTDFLAMGVGGSWRFTSPTELFDVGNIGGPAVQLLVKVGSL